MKLKTSIVRAMALFCRPKLVEEYLKAEKESRDGWVRLERHNVKTWPLESAVVEIKRDGRLCGTARFSVRLGVPNPQFFDPAKGRNGIFVECDEWRYPQTNLDISKPEFKSILEILDA